MIITMQDLDTVPVSLRRRLEELAQRWPAGLHVRHSAGWTGQVTADVPGNVHGGLTGGSDVHCLTGTRSEDSAVCVTWTTVDGVPATAWYRPAVLAPVGKAAPAAPKPAPVPKPLPTPPVARDRKRTRKGAA